MALTCLVVYWNVLDKSPIEFWKLYLQELLQMFNLDLDLVTKMDGGSAKDDFQLHPISHEFQRMQNCH